MNKQPNSAHCFICGVENSGGVHVRYYETTGDDTAERDAQRRVGRLRTGQQGEQCAQPLGVPRLGRRGGHGPGKNRFLLIRLAMERAHFLLRVSSGLEKIGTERGKGKFRVRFPMSRFSY